MNQTPSATLPQPIPFVPFDGLQVGDVLLMMGDGPLSELIAWASDSLYSHAAMVADNGELIEASLSGVRRIALQARIGETGHFRFIDAFRPLAPLDGGDRDVVLVHAQSLIGTRYPAQQLAVLGAIMALRGKWPVHPVARWVVRVALDHLVANDPTQLVCSELVYRAFAECDVQPVGRLAPEIVTGPQGTAPFPKNIDWKVLIDEVVEAMERSGRKSLLAAGLPVQGDDASGERMPSLMDMSPSDEELEIARAAALHALAAQAAMDVESSARGLLATPGTVPVNPKTVSPQDLAASPSLALLGRLMQRPADGGG